MKTSIYFLLNVFIVLSVSGQEEGISYSQISEEEVIFTCYYHKDGDYIRCFTLFRNDTSTVMDGAYVIIRNGFIATDGKYSNGKIAYIVNYYDNGKISHIVNFLNDSICEQMFFFEDGGIHSTGLYLYYRKVGTWSYYHNNGKLMKTEEYEVKQFNNKLNIDLYNTTGYRHVLFSSIKNGVWQFYDSEGRLQRTELYIDDFLVNFLEYDNKGNVIREAEGVFDLCTEFYPMIPCTTFAEPIDGFIKYFDPIRGEVVKTEYFEDGVLVNTVFSKKKKKQKNSN